MTADDYIKQAEALSLEKLGEINYPFIVGLLSVKITHAYQQGYNDGFEDGCAAGRGIISIDKKITEYKQSKNIES